TLSPEERLAFEQRLATDASLREELRLQQQLMQGIERTALKQVIQTAGTRFKTIRRMTRWGLPGLGIVVLTAVLVWYYGHRASLSEAGRLSAIADKALPARSFIIDASADTVLETKGGIVLSIPANVFLDEDGKPVHGKVQLSVREALDAASIMKAGLSTTSGNQLLESGGMFSIDASSNGKNVRIDAAKGIYAEVPARPFRPGMQLYSGKQSSDGRIDWINPVPLVHDLMSVDITTLDFYPPNYLDSLRSWGLDAGNKAFTDSLYYSVAVFFAQSAPVASEAGPGDSSWNNVQRHEPSGDTILLAYEVPFGRRYFTGRLPVCLINPAKIKAIRSAPFQ
ncbi:MAG: hypothetical protein JST39_17865, partial [Bacteroidetes bacterium]|nr:hypothetical protein [Bacteroidota bacterium]